MNQPRLFELLVCFYAALLCVPPIGWAEKNPEAFLDTPVLLEGEDIATIADLADVAAKLSGKPVDLVGGLSESGVKSFSNGVAILLSQHEDKTLVPLRKRLEFLCRLKGLKWRYDPKRDVIELSLRWQRVVTETPAEMLREVMRSPLPPAAANPRAEKWWEAFDGLLSSGTNFSKAMEVRVRGDVYGFSLPRAGDSWLVSEYRDKGGNERVLIVIGHPIAMSPGEGYASYYIFDPAGAFRAGGVIGTGWRCSDVRMELEGNTLTAIGYHNGTRPVRQEYEIRPDGLIFRNGSEKDGYGLGKFLFRTPAGESVPKS